MRSCCAHAGIAIHTDGEKANLVHHLRPFEPWETLTALAAPAGEELKHRELFGFGAQSDLALAIGDEWKQNLWRLSPNGVAALGTTQPHPYDENAEGQGQNDGVGAPTTSHRRSTPCGGPWFRRGSHAACSGRFERGAGGG